MESPEISPRDYYYQKFFVGNFRHFPIFFADDAAHGCRRQIRFAAGNVGHRQHKVQFFCVCRNCENISARKSETKYLFKNIYRNMDPIPFRMLGFFFPCLCLISRAAFKEDCLGPPRTLLKPSISRSSNGGSKSQCFFTPEE